MEKKLFGTLEDGTELFLYSFTNKNGMTMTVTELGATLVRVIVPDREGGKRDVVLGYDTPQDYLKNTCFFGAVIGRSGNRIDQGRFVINGKTYQLPINDNSNNLHSGPNGFDARRWEVGRVEEADNRITFCLESPDGDNGYPGNFRTSVTYTLTDDNTVELCYEATADADTIANMTNHTYFNLNGHDSGSIEAQELWLNADAYTPVRDGEAIPTGEITPVAGTPMDFTQAKLIGRDIGAEFEQLQYVGGYDHNFVLNGPMGEYRKFAEAYSEKSGIRMEAFTDCCGVQFYAGNFVTDQTGKDGVSYGKRHGFCLESQYYPNAINQENFPSPLLKAGETYRTKTGYRFSI